jgi:hypothetical protein
MFFFLDAQLVMYPYAITINHINLISKSKRFFHNIFLQFGCKSHFFLKTNFSNQFKITFEQLKMATCGFNLAQD